MNSTYRHLINIGITLTSPHAPQKNKFDSILSSKILRTAQSPPPLHQTSSLTLNGSRVCAASIPLFPKLLPRMVALEGATYSILRCSRQQGIFIFCVLYTKKGGPAVFFFSDVLPSWFEGERHLPLANQFFYITAADIGWSSCWRITRSSWSNESAIWIQAARRWIWRFCGNESCWNGQHKIQSDLICHNAQFPYFFFFFFFFLHIEFTLFKFNM